MWEEDVFGVDIGCCVEYLRSDVLSMVDSDLRNGKFVESACFEKLQNYNIARSIAG